MAIKTTKYIKCTDYKKLSLDAMYDGNQVVLNDLAYNLEAIINTEGPLTYNTLKERLREAFGISKISGKALEIILPILKKLNYMETNNLFDTVIWPDRGIFDIDFVRMGYERQIYDIPMQEIRNVFYEYKNKAIDKNELFHMVLNFFGYSVLTQKASEYLEFVLKNM